MLAQRLAEDGFDAVRLREAITETIGQRHPKNGSVPV
jgi:hypothetical protein